MPGCWVRPGSSHVTSLSNFVTLSEVALLRQFLHKSNYLKYVIFEPTYMIPFRTTILLASCSREVLFVFPQHILTPYRAEFGKSWSHCFFLAVSSQVARTGSFVNVEFGSLAALQNVHIIISFVAFHWPKY